MLPEIRSVEGRLKEELMKYFPGNEGYVQVGPEKWFYPKKYEKLAQDFIEFEVRSDDIWIMGIPRSGTTVTQDLVYILNNGFDDSKINADVYERVAFFEEAMFLPEAVKEDKCKSGPEVAARVRKCEMQLEELKKFEGKRMIKTHLPFALLPPDLLTSGCKIIYICRYPKDVALSYMHLQKKFKDTNFIGDFAKYWEFFQNGNCHFGPYFEHVRQGYEKRNLKNVLFVFYEELKKDLKMYIQKFSDFFERSLDEGEMENLLRYLNFDNFKKSINENLDNTLFGPLHLVGEGESGGWRNWFTDEMNEKADKWIEENCRKIGFSYPRID